MIKNNLTRRKYTGELALLIITVIWGGTFAVIKEALDDVSSMLFIAFRFTIAAVIVLPLFLRKRSLISKTMLIEGFFLGFLMFTGFAAQTAGLQYTTATKSGFLTGTAVVIIPLFQYLIERKKPTAGTLIGVVFVFAGVIFLSSGGESIATLFTELGGNFNKGDALTLLCAAGFALYVVYLDIYSKKYDLFLLVFMQVSVTAVLGYIFSWFFGAIDLEPVKVNFTFYLLFSLIYTGMFASLVATVIQTRFQKEVTPAKAGIIYSFEPAFAALIAWFFLAETIGGFAVIGSLLIFGGLLVSELYDNLKKNYERRKEESEDYS